MCRGSVIKSQNVSLYYDDNDIFNCNWVDTQWQQYSTHLHTNSTQNNTMKQNTQNITYITTRIFKLKKEHLT
jgi:hypothetical protein